VSDVEREKTVELLRQHTAEGRLTLDEFSERVSEVYAAKTRADLDQTLRELPRAVPRPEPVDLRRRMQSVSQPIRKFVFAALLLVGLWALTGAGHFWPAWPLFFIGLFTFRRYRRDQRRQARRAARYERLHGHPREVDARSF
jgi:hypothetical protein